MAEFCTKCTPKMLGEDALPDININQIFDTLNVGEYAPVLCEGCGLAAIGKFKNNTLLLAVPRSDGDRISWIDENTFYTQKPNI
jgi:hypothetical protein